MVDKSVRDALEKNTHRCSSQRHAKLPRRMLRSYSFRDFAGNARALAAVELEVEAVAITDSSRRRQQLEHRAHKPNWVYALFGCRRPYRRRARLEGRRNCRAQFFGLDGGDEVTGGIEAKERDQHHRHLEKVIHAPFC